MFESDKMREAILRENLGGWLFSTLKNRDRLSLSLLDIDSEGKNTRPWYYFILSQGEPIKIVHAIEQDILGRLPGDTLVYRSREELLFLLRDRVLPRLSGHPLACQFSPELPIISYLDHGTVLLLESAGFRPVSSAALIQRFRGLLSEEEIRSHEEAADHLYDIVRTVWDRLREAFSEGRLLREGEVRDWILREFEKRNLETDSSPTVAVGNNAGNPHYAIQGAGAVIGKDSVLQLDLWAKAKSPRAIYADISWVGFTGVRPPPGVEKDFAALIEVRDSLVRYIEQALEAEHRPSGSDVDRRGRILLTEAGYADALRHRTGHGIDREVHGSGVNLDSVEFPDHRLLLDGACFSVEPGIYFSDYGLRTEINVYIRDGRAVVSGGTPQRRLLTFG